MGIKQLEAHTLAPSANASIWIQRIAHERWSSPVHFKGVPGNPVDECWFSLVLSGELAVWQDGQLVGTFGNGALHVTRNGPGRNDELGVLAGQSCELLMLVLRGKNLPERICGFLSAQTAVYGPARFALLEQILRTTMRLVGRGGTRRMQECHTAAIELFLSVLEQGLCEPEALRPQGVRRYEQCMDLVERSNPAELSVQHLARQMGFDRSSLSRLFKLYHGEPLASFLRRRRLSYAAQLLRETDWTLECIAEACGYSDSFALSKAFRSHFGCPPSHYRRPGS
jgi:AraC-like DNA-binding protein